MDNKHRAKLDSYDRVDSINEKYQAILSAIPDYLGEKAKFDSAKASIKNSGAIQQQASGSETAVADAAKTALANTIVKYCMRAAVKARINGDLALAIQLECTFNAIYSLPKQSAVQVSTNLRNVLYSSLSALPNIDAAVIAEIDAAIAHYDAVKDTPTEAKHAKKANATDLLAGFFSKADEALNNKYDLVVSYLGESHPEIVNEITLAKQVIHTGIRSTSIAFNVMAFENDEILTGTKVTDFENGKIYNADEENIVHIHKHRAGHFHFTISAPNRTDVDFAADIKQGMSNNFTVKLKQIV